MEFFSTLILFLTIYILVWPFIIHANLSEQTRLLKEIAENTKRQI